MFRNLLKILSAGTMADNQTMGLNEVLADFHHNILGCFKITYVYLEL